MTKQEIKLTDEQIENYRKVFFENLGPSAAIMSIEQIQSYRDKLQERINGLLNNGRKENQS